jgi:hypothetical protein
MSSLKKFWSKITSCVSSNPSKNVIPPTSVESRGKEDIPVGQTNGRSGDMKKSQKIRRHRVVRLRTSIESRSLMTAELMPPTGTKRAVLIGINYLSDRRNRLNGCIHDVMNMRQLLLTTFQYSPDNIILLSDDQTDPTKIPTRANILAALQQAVSSTRAGDTLFIHYSGHGSQVQAHGNEEQNNPDTPNEDDCLCPCDFNDYPDDAGFIVDADLKELVVNKIPAGAKLRAFFDACHSGTMLDLEYLWKNDGEFLDEYPRDRLSDDVLMISGCRDSQTSSDSWNAQKKEAEGALTMMLIRGLTQSPKIKTTWKDLLLLTRHYLASEGYDQVPQLAVAKKDLVSQPIDL